MHTHTSPYLARAWGIVANQTPHPTATPLYGGKRLCTQPPDCSLDCTMLHARRCRLAWTHALRVLWQLASPAANAERVAADTQRRCQRYVNAHWPDTPPWVKAPQPHHCLRIPPLSALATMSGRQPPHCSLCNPQTPGGATCPAWLTATATASCLHRPSQQTVPGNRCCCCRSSSSTAGQHTDARGDSMLLQVRQATCGLLYSSTNHRSNKQEPLQVFQAVLLPDSQYRPRALLLQPGIQACTRGRHMTTGGRQHQPLTHVYLVCSV